MQNELGMRLSAAAALVLPGKTAADIGSDHMRLPMHLAEKGVCPRVIAADKVPLACKKGEALIAMAGLSHLIEVRCGDGLQVLRPGEAATIIITGMGGRLIRDILAGREATAAAAERLVLSPQKDAALLRNYLASSGWRIVSETAVFEAEKYYVMIAAERGEMALSAEEAEYGPCLLRDRPPAFLAQLACRVRELELIEDKLAASPGTKSRCRAAEIAAEKARLTEMLG